MTEIFGIPTQVLFGQLLIGLINGSFYALLSLGLARLRRHAPGLKTIGLSATVSDPAALCRWLVPQGDDPAQAELVEVKGGPQRGQAGWE